MKCLSQTKALIARFSAHWVFLYQLINHRNPFDGYNITLGNYPIGFNENIRYF